MFSLSYVHSSQLPTDILTKCSGAILASNSQDRFSDICGKLGRSCGNKCLVGHLRLSHTRIRGIYDDAPSVLQAGTEGENRWQAFFTCNSQTAYASQMPLIHFCQVKKSKSTSKECLYTLCLRLQVSDQRVTDLQISDTTLIQYTKI